MERTGEAAGRDRLVDEDRVLRQAREHCLDGRGGAERLRFPTLEHLLGESRDHLAAPGFALGQHALPTLGGDAAGKQPRELGCAARRIPEHPDANGVRPPELRRIRVDLQQLDSLRHRLPWGVRIHEEGVRAEHQHAVIGAECGVDPGRVHRERPAPERMRGGEDEQAVERLSVNGRSERLRELDRGAQAISPGELVSDHEAGALRAREQVGDLGERAAGRSVVDPRARR